MNKHEKTTILTPSTPSRSTALIAVSQPPPRRGLIARTVGGIAWLVLLPVRLPVLALVAVAKVAAGACSRLGQVLAAAGGGLLRVPILLARLVAMPFVGLARGGAWVAPRVGRGVGAVLMLPVTLVVALARGLGWVASRAGRGAAIVLLLPVRLVVLLARGLWMFAKGIVRASMFILRIPFVVLRLAARGAAGAGRGLAFGVVAVTVPVAALAWGLVRSVAAGIAAVVRGIATAVAFLGRLAGRGIAALLLGILATLKGLAIGVFVCVRATARALVWTILLPFRALAIVAVAAARGTRRLGILFADAVRTVAAGIVALVRGMAAVIGLAIRSIRHAAAAIGDVVGTREPQRASFLPLLGLATLGGLEMLGTAGFPFATVGLLLLAAFASLALLARPIPMGGVLLAWGLAVACGWRAERVGPSSPAWVDALVYLVALAALRSAYVAARAFINDAPVTPRDPNQQRAHGRASGAIGLVLAAQCIAFTLWSAKSGIESAALFGELLLVGAGAALAWVVRTGQYMRTAQGVLTLGALGSIVLLIAAQLGAFAKGEVFTAASIGAGLLLALVTGALTVVVHTRLLDAE
ncbi:MAG TPA: hypothetical protein VFY93_03750 [Planctomycetota bacterium]|nr:hypothetical protein [Planctomycetota bacterium]